MRYRIIKRIQDKQLTIGYQLVSEDNKVLNISKEQTLKAAYQGSIVNATYNNQTKSLSGTNGTDLRSLPAIQYSDIKSNKTVNNGNKQYKSNHQLAKEYILKQKLLGVSTVKLKLLENDRVKLIEVLDKESTGTFIVPKFITDYHSYFDDRHAIHGPFNDCRFVKIIMQNVGGPVLGYCPSLDKHPTYD